MKLHPGEFTDARTVVDYYKNITDHSVVSQVEPGYLSKILPNSAPQDGEAWEMIAKDFDSKIVPGITHWYGNQTCVTISSTCSRAKYLTSCSVN